MQHKIITIYISRSFNTIPDIDYWKFTSYGLFTTQSAYRLLLSQSIHVPPDTQDEQSLNNRSAIYILKHIKTLTKKLKYFLWLVFLNHLPFLEFFSYLLHITSYTCSLCLQSVKTPLPVLRDCTFALNF